MTQTIGRFYFKQSKNGNLLGEFSNRENIAILVECANRINDFNFEAFIGSYKTIWMEPDETIEEVYLDISYKENTNKMIYSLSWRDKEGKMQYFNGEGFLVDSILIGDYNNLHIPKSDKQ